MADLSKLTSNGSGVATAVAALSLVIAVVIGIHSVITPLELHLKRLDDEVSGLRKAHGRIASTTEALNQKFAAFILDDRDDMQNVNARLTTIQETQRIGSAAIAEFGNRFIEIETKAQGLVNALQGREAKWIGVFGMLWRKSYGEDPPVMPIVEIGARRRE